MGIIFLPFNLNKKQKLFIGDTGSIPTGFILGWLLISLANMGYLLSAILINLFFILDIALTLIIRILQRKSIFIRHNDFFSKNYFKKRSKEVFYCFIYYSNNINFNFNIFNNYLKP